VLNLKELNLKMNWGGWPDQPDGAFGPYSLFFYKGIANSILSYCQGVLFRFSTAEPQDGLIHGVIFSKMLISRLKQKTNSQNF